MTTVRKWGVTLPAGIEAAIHNGAEPDVLRMLIASALQSVEQAADDADREALDAEARGLFVMPGIHTFSNGTEHEIWAERNCYDCRFYDPDAAGACAFEGAAMIGMVSPALAEMFGWKRDAEYPDSWDAPDQCAFYHDGDDDTPDAPEPDPSQLVLLADPTEDATAITHAPITEVANA